MTPFFLAKVNNKLKNWLKIGGTFKKYVCSRGKGDFLLNENDK